MLYVDMLCRGYLAIASGGEFVAKARAAREIVLERKVSYRDRDITCYVPVLEGAALAEPFPTNQLDTQYHRDSGLESKLKMGLRPADELRALPAADLSLAAGLSPSLIQVYIV